MWSHLIQLMRARRALRAGRYDTVLGLLEDPLVRDDRRAVDLRAKVLDQLCDRAERRMKGGQLDLALRDIDQVCKLDAENARGLGLQADRLLGSRSQRVSVCTLSTSSGVSWFGVPLGQLVRTAS